MLTSDVGIRCQGENQRGHLSFPMLGAGDVFECNSAVEYTRSRVCAVFTSSPPRGALRRVLLEASPLRCQSAQTYRAIHLN